MSPHGCGTSKEPNEHPKADQRHRLLLREERRLDQPAIDQRVGAVGEPHGHEASQQALDRALQQEGPPDETVRGAHQPHDRDLATALQHGHADRGADDDDRHDGERRAHHESDRGGHLPQPVQLFHPVPAEPHVVHEPEPAQPVRDLVDVLGVAKPRLELQLDRGRQGVALQLLEHVAELDQLSPRAGQRRVLAHVRSRLHFGEGLDVFFCECNGLDRRAGQEVGHDLHALRHAAQGVLQIHRYQPEQADHEQRERDGRHRERGQEGRPAEREQRLADREVHGDAAWSRGSSTTESYTSAPSCSSITRYGAWRTRSRSCVAIKTAVPLALMSRSSWNTPRVARSSRLPVGSSASSTVGSLTRARAIATRCCSPPDSSRGEACALAASPTWVSTRITRAGMVERRAPVTSSANATFSSAVRSSSRRKSWNTMPSRRRSIGTSLRRNSATLNPETRTSPLVTGSSANTSFRTVDLPAPEWPVRNTNSPLAMWKETSFRASPPLGKALKTFVNLITYSCARACAKSAMMSSESSSPMENLRKPSGMPARARASGVSIACDVSRGSDTSVSTPPRLGACAAMVSARRNRSAARAPPLSSTPSMPPKPLRIRFATS